MSRKKISFDMGVPAKADLCRLSKGDTQYVYHKPLLLLLVLEGTAEIERMNMRVRHQKHDIAVIDSLCPYEIRSCEDNTELLLLYADTSYYKQRYPHIAATIFLSDIAEMIEDNEIIADVRSMILEVSMALSRDDFEGFTEIEYTMSRLLTVVLDSFQLFSPEAGSGDNSKEFCQRMQSIYQYMYDKTDESISLEDLSKSQHLSPYYLSHFIKRMNGIGFREIFEFFRVRKAETLISASSSKASEIARAAGFSATKYYKKYFELHYGTSFEDFCRKKLESKSYTDFQECSRLDRYKSIRDYIETMQLQIKSKGRTINEIVEINTEKTQGQFHNMLGFEGTMTNVNSNLSQDARDAILDIKKKFSLTGVYIYMSRLFARKAESNQYMIIAENINYLIKSEFEVVCFFDQTYKSVLKEFLMFLRFYLSRFRSTINSISYEIGHESGGLSAEIFEEELKQGVKNITGRMPVMKNRQYKEKYLELLDYIHDSFLLSPFAVDELIHPERWKDELNFALIDPVRNDGNILGGGYGLITWSGIKKPWWYAYEFIAQVKGDLLACGDDYIATKYGKQINLLIYNKCNYDSMKLQQIKSKEQLRNVIQYDGLLKKHTIFLKGLNGSYKVSNYSLDQKSCLFSKWADLEFPQYLSEDEEAAFAMTCHPDISIKKVEVKDSLELNILHPSFGVTLITIEKLEF